MKLALHAMLLHMNTNRLEVGNASLRRFVKKRVQCKPIAVMQLSMNWVAGQIRAQSASGKPKVDKASAPTHEAGPAAKPSAGGGAWRAFVRKQGSNDLTEVGRLYRALRDNVGDEVMAECIAEGQAATARRRAGHVGNSFGPSQKDVVRAQHRRCLASQAQQLASEGGEDAAFDKLMQDARVQNYSVEQAAKMARVMHRHVGQVARERHAADDRAMHEFPVQNTEPWREELTSAAPALRSSGGDLVAMPSPIAGARAFCLPLSGVAKCSHDLVAYCKDISTHQSNLLHNLDVQWARLHQVQRDDDADARESSESDGDGANDIVECWRAGFCLCDEAGTAIWRFRNAFLKALKQAFPFSAEPWKRVALGAGRAIVKLMSGGLIDGGDDVAELWGIGNELVFWHVSDMSFRPYLPTVQEMHVGSECDVADACPAEGEIVLKVASVRV